MTTMNDNYISSRTTIDLQQDQKLDAAPAQIHQETRVPDQKPEYTVANAKKYMTAELSLQLYGPVTDKVFQARRDACMGCDLRRTGAIPDSIGFCKGCGCGVSDRSRLSVKLTMPALDCPRGKFGKANGRHAQLKDRIKALFIQLLLK